MERYYDRATSNMLLGALYAYPALFETQEAQALGEGDFADPMTKVAFSIMYNLFSIGHSKFSEGIIESYIQGKPSIYNFYNKEIDTPEGKQRQGDFYFSKLREVGDPTLFKPSFDKVKKLTLLRNLERNGVSVKEFYDWDSENNKLIEAQNNWLEKTSLKDIADTVSDKISQIMAGSTNGSERVAAQAGDGLRSLIESFSETPDFGSPFPISTLNTITRGARLGKFYLRSAPTGGGKSRLMMADACHMAFDQLYNQKTQKWEENGIQEGALFISTELEIDELQTLALAYLTGIEEDLILDGRLDDDQKAVVAQGIEIMENSPLYFELIPDFSIQDIETTIRSYYREHDCKFFFFDYIHTSMKFLAEISSIANGMKLREDQILFMLSTSLKNLATNLHVFIESGTQVNGDYLEGELTQNLLRGAKSIADRVDVGVIATKVRPIDEAIVEELVANGYKRPNYIMSFYKIRRGKYAGTKLWCNANLGTCRVEPLYLTDSMNEVIPIDKTTINVKKQAERELRYRDKRSGSNDFKNSAF